MTILMLLGISVNNDASRCYQYIDVNYSYTYCLLLNIMKSLIIILNHGIFIDLGVGIAYDFRSFHLPRFIDDGRQN